MSPFVGVQTRPDCWLKKMETNKAITATECFPLEIIFSSLSQSHNCQVVVINVLNQNYPASDI